MITIKEADAATYEKWHRDEHMPFHALGMHMQDGSRYIGYIWYETAGELLRILRLEAPDMLLAEGLVRAALHYADCRSIESGVCSIEQWAALWNHLGFISNGQPDREEWKVSIREFFSRPCHGHAP